MIDLTSGVASPFTSEDRTAFAGVFSPNGEDVVYAALPRTGRMTESLMLKKSDGGSPPEEIMTVGTAFALPTSWSPDGGVVAFQQVNPKTKGWDIGVLSMVGNHQTKLLVHGAANEKSGEFSPDGKWLAYGSDESGSDQLYVIPYPGPGGKWQISSNGTRSFFWASDHELDNISSDGELFTIDLAKNAHGGLEIGSKRLLMAHVPRTTAAAYSRALGRFLFAIPTGASSNPPLTLVTHWTRLLEKR